MKSSSSFPSCIRCQQKGYQSCRIKWRKLLHIKTDCTPDFFPEKGHKNHQMRRRLLEFYWYCLYYSFGAVRSLHQAVHVSCAKIQTIWRLYCVVDFKWPLQPHYQPVTHTDIPIYPRSHWFTFSSFHSHTEAFRLNVHGSSEVLLWKYWDVELAQKPTSWWILYY